MIIMSVAQSLEITTTSEWKPPGTHARATGAQYQVHQTHMNASPHDYREHKDPPPEDIKQDVLLRAE